ncbi:MAG: flagellar M-ring protein FliF C-terminal domain-containing protein, partial [Candidatus Neomarinimicrobiota bacterium]|nr:flagellar M-ring protein FliF C-terminal domain-containing protein [Candidatus Neomarinimicrobiota bacterium]
MNKGVVMMKQWPKLPVIIFLGLFLTYGTGQESGFLAQKLMVENNLRERITNALSKVIDESRYVVDVSVDLELSDAVEEQVTFFTGKKKDSPSVQKNSFREIQPSPADPKTSDDVRSMVGLPIPGFEFELEQKPEIMDKPTISKLPEGATLYQDKKEPDPEILSKTSSYKRPSTAQIIKQEISIILQEGSSPELIENIRQLVMMASRFNRSRGDVLSIMTASFKERRDEKSAEQVLLKAIAEKIESLEVERSQRDVAQGEYGQEEIEKYKSQVQGLLMFADSVKAAAKDRAYRQEIEKVIAPYQEQIQKLQQETNDLKEMLGQPDAEKEEILTEVEQREKQIAEVDARIEEISNLLERTQEDLGQEENGGMSTTALLVSVFGVFILIVLIALVITLLGRSKQQYPPPPWMYPPRRPKRRTRKNAEKKTSAGTPAAPPQSLPHSAAPSQTDMKNIEIDEDP